MDCENWRWRKDISICRTERLFALFLNQTRLEDKASPHFHRHDWPLSFYETSAPANWLDFYLLIWLYVVLTCKWYVHFLRFMTSPCSDVITLMQKNPIIKKTIKLLCLFQCELSPVISVDNMMTKETIHRNCFQWKTWCNSQSVNGHVSKKSSVLFMLIDLPSENQWGAYLISLWLYSERNQQVTLNTNFLLITHAPDKPHAEKQFSVFQSNITKKDTLKGTLLWI